MIKGLTIVAVLSVMHPQPVRDNVQYLIKDFKWHQYNKDTRKLDEFVDVVRAVSSEYPEVTSEMLITTAYAESTFRQHVVSSTGARSTFQLAPSIAQHVKDNLEPRCTLRTTRGSAYCAGAWLNHCLEKCGGVRGAFTLYVQGRTCRPRSTRARKEAASRVRLMRSLEARTGSLFQS